MSAKKSFASRKFYSLPENPNRVSKNKLSGGCKKREDSVKLVKYVDENLVGKNTSFIGPYGRRKVIYCDYADSGRSLQFIEEYILREVLPNCGTANNTTNLTSLQSVLFRQDAKEILRICVNATDDDVVIFSGLCSRDPIERLLQDLNLKEAGDPPVVFVGSCERLSAILPWKKLGAKVVRIAESKEGFLDLNDLENQLMAHRNCAGRLIGCFSVANNVTGILADDVATTLLLHQYGALAFWDYGTAAPYVQLDMNPTLPGVEESAVHKDVMFFSCHKFIGGIQTPGVLIAKKNLFRNSDSDGFSVLDENERQVVDMDLQDDRSTATVVADVRAGLVMHLKEAIGVPAIMAREEKITRTVLAHAKNIPEMVLLGNSSHSLKRLPFFSFMVRHPRGMFLHHNFVCTVLNDIFGIQARGSCADADSHSLDFMGIDMELAEQYRKLLLSRNSNGATDVKEEQDLEILRPGFVRISLPFCISDAELGFVLEALKMVATEGWKLLAQYSLKPSTGEWRHHSNCIFKDRKWLGTLKYVDGRLVVPERKISNQGTCPTDYEECLHVARCIFNKARKIAQRCPLTAQKFAFDPEVEPLRWFMLPSEAHNLLIGNSQNVRHKVPFDPNRYTGCKGDPLLEFNKGSSDEKSIKANKENLAEEDKKVLVVQKECEMEKDVPSSSINSQQSVPNLFHHHPHHHVSSERLNSFSSEISSSDCFEYQSSHHSPQFYPSMPSYGVNSNYSSSPLNPLDVFCQSPQPPMPSPLMNHMDFYSTQFYQHPNNYAPLNSYSNQYNNGGFADNSFQVDQNLYANHLSSERLPHSNNKPETQYPVNKVHFLLGRNESSSSSSRQRCNSLGSGLVVNPRNRGNSACGWRSLTDGDASLNLSECSLSSNEDIQAYVTEVTKELATEIKSEIREVISKVEDVLSESVDPEGGGHGLSEHRGSRCLDLKCEKLLERTNSLPSASANDIAQYLMGVSKEMAEEMKSEIRGLVNSFASCESSPGTADKREKKVTAETWSKEKGKEKVKKSEVEALSNESISQSRDSGINLSYSETPGDSKVKEKETPSGKAEPEEGKGTAVSKRGRSHSLDSFREDERTSRCRTESLDSLQENEGGDAASKSQVSRRKANRISKKAEKGFAKDRLSGESSNDEETNAKGSFKPRWCCPTKAVWKPAVEALKEFEMIRNGDKILVCLSGGKNSLAILHTLQQYKFYAISKGIDFELGAVTFNPDCPDRKAKALTVYLEALGIPCHFEEGAVPESPEANGTCSSCWKTKRGRLYAMARKEKYNVVALGQDLDDVAESFLLSVFHDGKLRSVKAHHYAADKDIRTIRPFVYVREKALRQFAENKNLPGVPENCPSCRATSKERQNSKQLLSHQESTFPRLFSSLKAALHPLISSGCYPEGDKKSDKCVTDSDETSST